jgi:hypothetical protein
MKILECKRKQIYDVGFIDPNNVHEYNIERSAESKQEVEELLLRFLVKQQTKSEILFPYNFK